MRKLIFLLGFFFMVLPARAADTYFAQNSTGGGNGSDCANARAVGTHNSADDGPGRVNHFCGTISTEWHVLASGGAGNPTVLKFEPGANFTSPAFNPEAISLGGHSYVLVDGGVPCGPGTTCSATQAGTGVIQNTANGTLLANHVGSNGVDANDNHGNGCGHDIEVRNLLVLNMYVKQAGGVNDNSAGAASSNGIVLGSCGSNMFIHDNTATWGHSNLALGSSSAMPNPTNWQIYNNVTRHATWGINIQVGNDGDVPTNAMVYGNDIDLSNEWSQPDGTYHLDGIFAFGHSATGYFNGVYIYNNYLHGNWANGGQCPTGFIYANQNLQNVYIFNNIFNITANYACNGIIALGFGNTSNGIFNNTIVATGTGGGVALGNPGGSLVNSTTVLNNVFAISSPLNYNDTTSPTGGQQLLAVDYNVYRPATMGIGALSGILGWTTGGNGPWNINKEYDTFAAWQGAICDSVTGVNHCDAHGSTNDPKLDANFKPQSGSSASAMAKNLTGLCAGKPNPGLGALCYDKAGNARPTSGNWDAGAYILGSSSVGSAPQPPVGLVVTAAQ